MRAWLIHLLYNFLFYGFCLVASPYVLARVLLSRKQRSYWRRRLGDVPVLAPQPDRIWVHGVSVGEIKAARPIVRELSERFPALEIVLSTTTGTGDDAIRARRSRSILSRTDSLTARNASRVPYASTSSRSVST